MKKILLTLALAFCCVAGQGQTTAIPAGVNIQELNTKWAKFTQYAEQKQINKAVEEGIRVSTLFTQNRQSSNPQLSSSASFLRLNVLSSLN